MGIRVLLEQMEYITGTIALRSRKRSGLSCVSWLCLVVILPATVCAQSGSTDLRASVSKTITVSLAPNASNADAQFHAFENSGALRLVFSGSEFKRNLQVPILIRSNTSYKISASVQSQTAVLTQLYILSVEAGGNSVAGDAVTGFAVERAFDMRRGASWAGKENHSRIDAAVPFKIFNGPRISLGGRLDTPHNALRVVLLLSVQGKAQGSWTLVLKLQGGETDMP